MSRPAGANTGPLPQAVFSLVWALLSTALLLALPVARSRLSFGSVEFAEWGAVIVACAYLGGSILLSAARLTGARVGAWRAAGFMLFVFCGTFLYFLMSKPPPATSRAVLAMVLAGALAATVIGFAIERRRPWAIGILAVVVAVVAGYAEHRVRSVGSHVEANESDISTGFYAVHRTSYAKAIPATDVRGGGLSLIGGDYLLATGDGRLYVFNWDGNGKFAIHPLSYRVPLDIDEFAHDANPDGYAGKPNGGDQADRLQGVQTWQFRVADIHVQEQGDRVRIFASHHFWKRDQQCFVVRVSSLTGPRAAVMAGDPALHWQTVWESQPCIPLRGADSVHLNNSFAGMEVGGRIGLIDDDTLLLTLGDHDFTGVESKQMFSQDPNVSYGKTILIHLRDGHGEIFTLGHRNPQGLYITAQGDIWSTEHGPQGGDELNYLVRGANYGWPLVTYGTDYGSASWPLNKTPGRHDGFQEPIFAWIPSIGVSNLIRVEKDRFPVWKGDLLVSSLHAHSLFRLRVLDKRVVFSEPIEVGERIRDIVEGPDGRVVLWTDSSSIVSLTPSSATGGAVLFANTCGGCHKAIDGATHAYGPDLAGVVGRRVASAEGYGSYSPALKALGGSWDRKRLDQFLQKPQAMAPGTAMTFAGVQDPDTRAAIIDYLATTRHY